MPAKFLGIFIFYFLFLFGNSVIYSNDINISTNTKYNITKFIIQKYPEFNNIISEDTQYRRISENIYIALFHGKIGEHPGYGVFILNISSNTVVKKIDIFPSFDQYDNYTQIEKAGIDFAIITQYSDYGAVLSRVKYFFDLVPENPVKKYLAERVNITNIEIKGDKIFAWGSAGQNKIMIKLTIRNGLPETETSMITPMIENEVESKINISENEKIYSPSFIKEDEENLMLGYSGKCDVINTSSESDSIVKEKRKQSEYKTVWLPNSYHGIFKRDELSKHIINISSSPIHNFFISNNQQLYPSGLPYGIYEIEDKKCRFYPIPEVTIDMIKKFRNGNDYCLIDNQMGAFQRFNDEIWFCSDFYDAEGVCGLGGIGYFNLKTKKYQIIRSTQIAEYGCSALLMEGKEVFIGLSHRGEGEISSGGLAIFDIKSNKFYRWDIPSVINIIKKIGDSLIMGTKDGIYILTSERKILYIGPEINENGEYELIMRQTEKD